MISQWFDDGLADAANRWMVVRTDTFDGDDYPSYHQGNDDAWAVVRSPGSMQRVIEVYDLTADKAAQLAERRTWRLTSAGVTLSA